MKGSKQRGFTLLELIFSLAIATILALLSIPSFQQASGKNKADSITSSIYRQINFTRQTAIASNERVILCGHDKKQGCTSKNIESMIVFIDLNNDFLFDKEKEEILNSVTFAKGDYSIKWNRKLPLRYRSDGTISFPGSFIFCPQDKKNVQAIRRITVNRTGRAYIAKKHKKKGIVLSASGKEIHC